VYSYHGMHADAGTFAVYAGTAPHKAATVLDVVTAELGGLVEHGLDSDELERAKGHLAGSMVLALEDTGSRMTRIGKSVVTGSPLLSLDETIAAVEAVTAEAAHELAAELLTGPFTLAAVGKVEPSDEAHLSRYVARNAA
jgi:predicted Zn-dependent peptidase